MEHYIDNFVTVGKQGSSECRDNLDAMLRLCEATGTPIDPEKTKGPCTSLTFFRIEMDMVQMQLRLPEDKLAWLVELLQSWQRKKCCKKRDLLSLTGVLAHACKVIRPGWSFLRRLIDLGKRELKNSSTSFSSTQRQGRIWSGGIFLPASGTEYR